MRILHVCLAANFTENMTYQENLLAEQNVVDGHEVRVIADCSMYVDGRLEQTVPSTRRLATGVTLTRLPLLRLLPRMLTYKLRIAKGLYSEIASFDPDIILYHGVVGAGLLTVGKYKKCNPHVKLYIDSHEDFHNSARNWISKWIQYKIITRMMLSVIRGQVEKFLYVSMETADFLRAMYGLKDEEMEFYPLGGYIIEEDERRRWRAEIREELGFAEDNIVLVHSGKLAREKRTVELLRAFASIQDPSLRLCVVGSIPSEQSEVLQEMLKQDSRVKHVGWVDGQRLTKILCAADCYVQPGTQSATLQLALCCSLPVVVYPYPSHEPYVQGNGFYAASEEELAAVLRRVSAEPAQLADMASRSYRIARELLDYRTLAARLYR